MRDDVMWAWDYELRTLGSWPGERYTGHNVPVEVVTKADHDAALRRAKADGLEQVSELKKALELYRDASYQGHSSHWDKTGGSGSGCPACLRAIELRAQARQIVDTLDARAAQIEEGE